MFERFENVASVVRHPLGMVALMRTARSGVYVPHGSLSEADCIMAQSFGNVAWDDQGRPPEDQNKVLADFIGKMYQTRPMPIIAQHEVAEMVMHQGIEVAQSITEHRRKGRYLDSKEVLAQSIAYMRDKNLERPLVVAAPHHISRVDAMAHGRGLDTIVLPGIEAVWRSDSTQSWTRNPESWFKREWKYLGFAATTGLLRVG